jgi:hypothetical protein
MEENGSDGNVHKLELVYYPTTTTDGRVDGLKRPQPDDVIGTDFRDLGDDEEPYRWYHLLENQGARDDHSRIIEFSKTLAQPATSIESSIEAILDTDQMTRVYAVASLCGVNDAYLLGGLPHNLMLWVRPSDRRIVLLPWDQDFCWHRATSNPLWGGEAIARLFTLPRYQRMIYGHYLDIIENTFHPDYLSRWTDHYGRLAEEERFFDIVQRYIGERRSFVQGRIPRRVPFEITTNGGDDFSVDELTAPLEGTAWVDAHDVLFDGPGGSPAPRWTRVDRWTIDLPLVSGPNEITAFAFDASGELLGVDTIVVTSTSEPPPGRFRRGDADQSGRIDVSDAIVVLRHLFAGRPMACRDAGDANDDEILGITDGIHVLEYLFRGGPTPPPPFEAPGADPTGDGSLDCVTGI